MNQSRPGSVFVHLTKACNLRCRYCYFSAARPMPNELTREEYARFWADLVTLKPDKVVLTGGEPLLRPDFWEILGDLADCDSSWNIRRCLNTNGYPIDEQVGLRLIPLVNEVRVSIDGPAEVNDRLRGPGSADRALSALKILLSLGFEPKVLITVTAENQIFLPDFVAFLRELGIVRFGFNPVRQLGRALQLVQLAPDLNSPLGLQHPETTSDREETRPRSEECSHCGVGTMLNVVADGKVYPCHELERSEFLLGDLRTTSVSRIWEENVLLRELREVDFEAVGSSRELSRLAAPGSCLGQVYAKTIHSGKWREALPSLGQGGEVPRT